jgi:ABC-type phosphate transport system ATPase subunit
MCIARTLLTDPQVLLLDEPTSALDVDARLRVEGLLVDLVLGGLGALWVTHDLDQAERLIARCAGRLVVLMGGRVVPEEVAQRSMAARSFAVAGGTDDANGAPHDGRSGS